MSHYTMPSKYGNCTARLLKNFKKAELVVFTNKVGKNSQCLADFFNKTIITLALGWYKMIIANSALRASSAISISYPTRTRGIIVK